MGGSVLQAPELFNRYVAENEGQLHQAECICLLHVALCSAGSKGAAGCRYAWR